MPSPLPSSSNEVSSPSWSIDIFSVENGAELELLARSGNWQVLESSLPISIIEELSENDVWFRTLGSSTALQKFTWRAARIVAGRYAETWRVPPAVLAEALFFPLWPEICVLLACRRVARHLAAQMRPRFLVPLPSADVVCFSQWGVNGAAGLFLAYELQRRGAEVAFVRVGSERPGKADLTFHPSRAIKPLVRLWPFGAGRISPVLICEAGIRRPDAAPPAARTAGRLRQHNVMRRVWLGDALFNPWARPRQRPLSIRFERVAEEGRFMRYRGAFPQAFALRVLEAFWAGPVKDGWANAVRLVERRKTVEVFVCDHHFFESALVAGAVKACGGTVTLLPHSTNPLHRTFRSASSFDAAVATTRLGAAQWSAAFPDKKVSVRPTMMLPPIGRKAAFDPISPLTIVIVGGAEILGGLPCMRIKSHKATYRRFLAVPEAVRRKVNVVFKPKPGWEDEAWFAGEMAGAASVPVAVERRPILKLDHPNMVFVSVTVASSALLEGVAQGIPAVIVADQTAAQYVPVEGSPVAMVPSSGIWAYLDDLSREGAYAALVDAQMAWLSEEIYGEAIGDGAP
ncbi:hypothetical protein [Parvibaculum sp.]|uniref:hypothetical protein n=1 Tax=Parvibaculum sp. TaxID=2024848 RepID=UPI0034A09025